MDFTTRLLLNKPNPDPVTGDFVDITKLNENSDKIDGAISFTVCTSTSRPAVPFQGQSILETDTGKTYIWGGSAWLQLLVGGPNGQQFDSRIGLGVPPSSLANRMLRVGAGATGTGSLVRLETTGTSNGNRALSMIGSGETQDRFWIDFDGRIHWGPGTSVNHDTNLYRAAANILKTDFNLEVVGSLTVGGVVPGSSSVQVFTASGTWTKPAGAKRVWVRMVGGGGAGGGAQTAVAGAHSKGGGGGGGEYAEIWYDASALSATEALTVGAGATGGTGIGATGGTTTFKGVNAIGGSGGSMNTSNSASWGQAGGDGGTGGTGTATLRSGGQGGAFGWGDGPLSAGGSGGSSALGGGGKSVSSGATISSIQGDDASGYGGGGGGALVNTTGASIRGGHGKAGVVIITTFF